MATRITRGSLFRLWVRAMIAGAESSPTVVPHGDRARSKIDAAVGLVPGGWQLREGNSVVDADTLKIMRDRTNWGELLDN